MCRLVCFNQGRAGVPCPHFLALIAPSCIFVLVTTPTSAVVSCSVFRCWGCCAVGGCEEGLRGVVDLVGFVAWCAYLWRFSPAPSSHWGRFMLIRCDGTLDPRMQR